MVKAVLDELASDRPRRHFTVGIYDDVTHLSLDVDHGFRTPAPTARCRPCSSGSAPTARSGPTRHR